MSWKALIVIVVWLSFFSFWVIASFIYRTSKAKKVDKNWFLFLISIILFTALVEYIAWEYLLKRFEPPSPFNQLINLFGIILLLSGFFFAVWARIRLGSFWSGSVAVIEGQPVIRDGPYSIARHPIYTGVIAMLWGSFLIIEIGFLLLTAILSTILLIWKARLEETMLERYKGQEYTNYNKNNKCIHSYLIIFQFLL
jgi:protein-S-isoprenylcysteine O-methyltransferase Ste14